MKYIPKKSAAILIVAALLLVPALSRAQFGGVVFDPTNLQERVLRYLSTPTAASPAQADVPAGLEPLPTRAADVEKPSEHASAGIAPRSHNGALFTAK